MLKIVELILVGISIYKERMYICVPNKKLDFFLVHKYIYTQRALVYLCTKKKVEFFLSWIFVSGFTQSWIFFDTKIQL